MSPNELANRRWWEAAFPGHPYAVPVNGTLETFAGDHRRRHEELRRARFSRKTRLKIGIVGNVDAGTAGKIVDRIFGGLPAKANLVSVPEIEPKIGDGKVSVEIDVPQSVVMVGGAGISRKDPDFIPAYVLNHILGGGSFSSRLYREVREVRGLAYSVYSTLMPLDRTALFVAGTATRSDRAEQSLDVIKDGNQPHGQGWSDAGGTCGRQVVISPVRLRCVSIRRARSQASLCSCRSMILASTTSTNATA